MICNECGGILFVIKVHDEKDITKDRLCDVQCIKCENILYYQPYDGTKSLNAIKGNKKE
jgi:hypothetical protein